MAPLVSVIILTWNGAAFIQKCLAAVLQQIYTPLEVIVVDNASTDDTLRLVESVGPAVRVMRNPRNLGFAGGNNVGLQAAQGEIVVLLNQDTVVQPGWLAAIAASFTEASLGVVGCKALYPDGTIQHAGAYVCPGTAYTVHIGRNEIDAGQYDRLTEVDYVTGAALALHRRVLERIGLLDEQFFPAFYEEVDYCYRARRAGFKVVYQPQAVLRHFETASSPIPGYRSLIFNKNRVRFILRQWSGDEIAVWQETEKKIADEAPTLEDVLVLRQAYLENLMALPAIARLRRSEATLGGSLPEATWEALQQTLGHWSQALLRRAFELAEKIAPVPLAPRENLHEVLYPQSPVPILGPWVTRFRAWWLDTMVRPYCVPILQQQVEYNQYLLQCLEAQNEHIRGLRGVILMAQLHWPLSDQDLLRPPAAEKG